MSGFLGRVGRALERMEEAGPPRMEVLWPLPAGAPGRVGFVAGSFDPMTVAHAALADALAGSCDLILFLYASRTLPKEAGPAGPAGEPLLAARDRVASLLAYCRARPGQGVAVCSHGLYADQTEAAARSFPESDVVFGMGSDKLVQLADPSWYQDRHEALDRLFSSAGIAYAERQGDDERLAAALQQLSPWTERIRRLDLLPELAGVSSRSVREQLVSGADISDLVPPEILPFIQSAGPRS